MNTPQEVIDHWTAKIMAAPERVATLGGTFKFVVPGAQGGVWRVQCRAPVQVSAGEGPADCVVTLSEGDFVALASKKLNPQMAFLEGRLRLSGDVALALRLAEIL